MVGKKHKGKHKNKEKSEEKQKEGKDRGRDAEKHKEKKEKRRYSVDQSRPGMCTVKGSLWSFTRGDSLLMLRAMCCFQGPVRQFPQGQAVGDIRGAFR